MNKNKRDNLTPKQIKARVNALYNSYLLLAGAILGVIITTAQTFISVAFPIMLLCIPLILVAGYGYLVKENIIAEQDEIEEQQREAKRKEERIHDAGLIVEVIMRRLTASDNPDHSSASLVDIRAMLEEIEDDEDNSQA